jgi:bifunctional non-homologous end joining protein LigD
MAPRRKADPKDQAGTTPVNAADAVDQQLARYRSMRDFGVTAEPSGKSRSKSAAAIPAGQQPFVIQKHAATRLHYDFRLGWNGVLKSWAVTKGPSFYVGDKRLAVEVEDHPMEYGGFEGIIPKGQYGGGTVMVWDQGSWEPQPGHTDVDAGLRDGSLKFILHGTKLHGKWALIRMKPRPGDKKNNWLLIKEHDEYERAESDSAITDEAPNSAVTGRSIEEIARAETHVWNSKDTATGKAWFRNEQSGSDKGAPSPAKAARKRSPPRKIAFGSALDRTPKEHLPAFILPQLATQASEAPRGTGWVHELKLDGYRIQARKDSDRVQLLTRTGLDWTHRMKSLAAELAELPAESAIIDGEVVVLSPSGSTSFANLQAAFQEGAKHPLTYFAFDLLHLNGHNLRDLALTDRKALLSRLLENPDDAIRYSDHVDAPGDLVFKEACKLHAEGIISKRADGKYISSRTTDWRKLKCIHEQELVIGGFTLPSNNIYGVGALLLGYYQKGKLIYAGRTGTGFTRKIHADLRSRLDKLRRDSAPFDTVPPDARNGAIWVKPELVAQVHFATWSTDNLVRQAAFQGLREDKPASEVRREEPTTPPSAGKTKHAAKHAAHPAPAPAAPKNLPAKKSAKASQIDPPDHAPVRLTHPDKVLDAESGLTKQQLADYYWAIAPHMLPHIANRPLSLVRCPDGSGHPCFFQKHVNNTLPPDTESVPVRDRKTGKVEPYITLSTPKALAGLAQLGVLEVHPWGSCNDSLERPDRIIIDLDPDAAIEWETLAASAADVRKQLKSLGLESFLKTTGGKGLHVVLPIEPDHDWPVIKQFTHAFVLEMEKRDPRLYLTKMTKAARTGRIFLDYLRNQREATAVAPYSPRARAGAPVSMPIPWTALKESERPAFHVTDYDDWKPGLRRDPWKDLPETKQSITAETLKLFKIST